MTPAIEYEAASQYEGVGSQARALNEGSGMTILGIVQNGRFEKQRQSCIIAKRGPVAKLGPLKYRNERQFFVSARFALYM